MNEFALGHVVLPAADGVMQGLGYDVPRMGGDALGVVIETRKNKAQIFFPQIKLKLWLDNEEMADVEAMAASGHGAYVRLAQKTQNLTAEAPLVWWMQRFCKELPVSHILNVEGAPLGELWDAKANGDLKNYYQGSYEGHAWRLSLGIEELVLSDWERVRTLLGDKLLFARFLPAGLYKLELALYLR